MTETLITLKDVTFSYGDEAILKHYNLEVKIGEILVIMGPSGVGKSTLLKIMSGLLSVTEGKVVQSPKVFENVHTPFPFVFQDVSTLLPWCTIYQNLKLVNETLGKQEIEAILSRVGLKEAIYKKVNTLSGGMKQRVGLARALACKSKIIFMDEPFASLDQDLREDLYAYLKELQSRLNLTIVLVTHHQDASTIATRVINL